VFHDEPLSLPTGLERHTLSQGGSQQTVPTNLDGEKAPPAYFEAQNDEFKESSSKV
jgi:hypothetical protein